MRTALVYTLFAVIASIVLSTPLDDYVNSKDPTFSFSVLRSIPVYQGTAYILEMTSQKWPVNCNRQIWTHYMTIVIPDKLTQKTAFLDMEYGLNTDAEPTTVNDFAVGVAAGTQSIVAGIQQIPNGPTIFDNDGIPRIEDDMVAYTWAHFLNDTTDPVWINFLPMTKAIVRAMDTVQIFAREQVGFEVANFVVSGMSKRGWTTLMTAAVDQRVIGIVPVVIDILHMAENLNKQWKSYGAWSPALQPYEQQGVLKQLNSPQMQLLANIIDPINYLDRLTMPKLFVCATGDEFFLPDDPNLFFSQLLGEKYLLMVPNTDHPLLNGGQQFVYEQIAAFYQTILTNTPRPEFTWSLDTTNSQITVQLSQKNSYIPQNVSVWQSYNPLARDFRWGAPHPASQWTSTLLHDLGGGQFVAKVNVPAQGWTAFFVSLTFPMPGIAFPMALTSEVLVVPDTYPFPPCGNNC